MKKSESIASLTQALVKVQSQLKGAKADSVNPFFKAKYASLSSVWEACRKLLADNELVVIQTTSVGDEHKLIIDTTLAHSSGEWITGQLPMILNKEDPQGIGQAITYGRRYGLSAIIGICPEDDDAESTVSTQPKKQQAKPTKEPTPVKDGESMTTESLFQWVADKKNWKKPTASRSFLVNKCKIAEERIDNEPQGVYEEVKELMDW